MSLFVEDVAGLSILSAVPMQPIPVSNGSHQVVAGAAAAVAVFRAFLRQTVAAAVVAAAAAEAWPFSSARSWAAAVAAAAVAAWQASSAQTWAAAAGGGGGGGGGGPAPPFRALLGSGGGGGGGGYPCRRGAQARRSLRRQRRCGHAGQRRLRGGALEVGLGAQQRRRQVAHSCGRPCAVAQQRARLLRRGRLHSAEGTFFVGRPVVCTSFSHAFEPAA